MGLAGMRPTFVQHAASTDPVYRNLYPRVYAYLYDGVRLRLQPSTRVRPSYADVQVQGVATMPHSAGAQNGLLYC